jgi:uncharacterized protein (TIGR00266 family)
MRFELQHQPSSTIAVCHLEPQETLVSEGGAMMALKGPVSVNTTTHQKGGGGVLAGVKRLLSGESFFLNQYQATQPSQVWLCSALPGDMVVKKLNGENLVIAGGSFVACDHNVQIKLEWQGLKSVFSGESMFWIKAHGKGDLLLNSFGFIYPVQVDGEYIVDTGHIVAFEETLQFNISTASKSWLQAYLSGEGFICRFKGKGTVWCQSHNPKSYGQELAPYLKPRG